MFNSKLAKIATKILSNGNYTPLDDIIRKYPNGVKINGITMKAAKNQNNAIAFTFNDTSNVDVDKIVTVNQQTGDVMTINNDNDIAYFFAESGDLKKLANAWLAEMTLDEIDNALAESPITLKIYKIITRNGRPYVKAHIVENDNNTPDNEN